MLLGSATSDATNVSSAGYVDYARGQFDAESPVPFLPVTSGRRAVIVSVAVTALLGGAFAVVAVAARGRDRRVRASATTTTSTTVAPTTVPSIEPTTTTYDLTPSTTTTASTVPAATSTTTTTAPPLPVVSSAGAVLKPPGSPTTRTMTGSDCSTLATAASAGVACGEAHAKGGVTLVWLVEGSSAGVHRRHAYVFAPAPGSAASGASGASGAWKSVLEAVDPDGSGWQSVQAVVVDLSGDGADDIAFGFRSVGSGLLAVDVVEGPGAVTAHRDLAHGAARVSPGQWDTWAASGAPDGQYDHDVIRWQDNAWRLVMRSSEPASSVPPTQL